MKVKVCTSRESSGICFWCLEPIPGAGISAWKKGGAGPISSCAPCALEVGWHMIEEAIIMQDAAQRGGHR